MQNDGCSACREVEDLAVCRVCKKQVCSRHRSGTGSLSDGYNCAGTGSACWLGFVGEELKTPVHRRTWGGMDVTLWLCFLVLTLFGVALGFLPTPHPH